MFGYQKRYCFTGQLYLKTALHIGGGEIALGASDHPVVRRPDGEPFIPGSSFKGAFRSTVEKLAATIGIWTCNLMKEQGCVGARSREKSDFDQMLRDPDIRKKGDIFHHLNGKLCHTCQLFGSGYVASKFHVSDLHLLTGERIVTQRRDGVAINRDSECAEDGLKFDYEVVPPTLKFDCTLWLENPLDPDLGLVCLGLSEFCSGFAGIGGKRSRGLGNCELRDLKIYEFNLEGLSTEERGKRLLQYLQETTLERKLVQILDTNKFMTNHIAALLSYPNWGKPSPKGEMAHA